MQQLTLTVSQYSTDYCSQDLNVCYLSDVYAPNLLPWFVCLAVACVCVSVYQSLISLLLFYNVYCTRWSEIWRLWLISDSDLNFFDHLHFAIISHFHLPYIVALVRCLWYCLEFFWLRFAINVCNACILVSVSDFSPLFHRQNLVLIGCHEYE